MNDIVSGYHKEPVPDRLWYKIKGSIENKQRVMTLFNLKALGAACVCVVLLIIGGQYHEFQKKQTEQLVNDYINEVLFVMDMDDERIYQADLSLNEYLGTF